MFYSTCVMWSLSHFSYCIHFSWLHTRQWHTAAWHHGIPQQTYLSGKKDFVHLTLCGSAVVIPRTPRSTKDSFLNPGVCVIISLCFFLKHIPKNEMLGYNVEALGKKAPSCISFHHSKMEDFWHNQDSPSASLQTKEILGKESWQKARPRTRRKNSKRSSITVVLHESELYGRQARQKPLLHKRHVKALLEFTEGWWWHQHAVGVSSAVETRGLVRGWGESWM